jgi:hypothetical protein
MIFVVTFFIELIILFFLSRELTRSFTYVMFNLLKSKKITVMLLALLFFPGTLIHELSHFLMAKVLFVHTGKMHLLPRIEGDGVILGSVGIGHSDIFRRMLIGAAPFLFGTTLLLCTLFYVTDQRLWEHVPSLLVAGYIVFEVGNTMFSSKKDREGMLTFLSVFGILAILLYIAGLRFSLDTLAFFLTPQILILFEKGSYFMIIPLMLDVLVILFFKLLTRMIR